MSPFCIRYNCLQLTKEVNEYYTTYVSRVNSQAERFKLNVLSSGPAMDISGTCSVMGSNQFTPEAEYTISELLSSQQGDFLLNIYETVAVSEDKKTEDSVNDALSPELNEALLALQNTEIKLQTKRDIYRET
ncbi:unnamed protein product [Schistosoma margrebowiei]|uniref:Uncharacterized protein n=1 Tax=Schistosoma margrebowiei TaxID=48269 RepID=A0A183LWV9_9TREM|nr:unnamed protein product [Schistosoma margrebowiei]